MKPETRTFTKENPCTKKDLWHCFRTAAGFQKVQVGIAHSLIGVNAPRVMERNGYLVKETLPTGDFFSLTPFGRLWLEKGIHAYLKNHPAEQSAVKFLAAPPARGRRNRRP